MRTGIRMLLGALALLALLPARKAVTMVLGGARGAGLIPVLARTGQVQIVYAVLLAAGLFISA